MSGELVLCVMFRCENCQEHMFYDFPPPSAGAVLAKQVECVFCGQQNLVGVQMLVPEPAT